MRQAIDIFGYGLKQLFGNLGTALRLTGLVWIIASLLIYAIGYALVEQPISAMALRPDAEGQMPNLTATFTMVTLVINLVAVGWVSLIWSRFCLGADTPQGMLPSLRGLPFGSYMITLILVCAVVGAVGFVISLIGSWALPYMPFLVGVFVYPIVSAVLLIWLILRVGASLPATAAGQVLSLTQSWSGSREKGILGLTVLIMLLVTILSIPSVMLSGLLIPGNIASIVVSWLIVLLGTGWLAAIFRAIPPVQK